MTNTQGIWKIASKHDGQAIEVLRKYRTEDAARMALRLAEPEAFWGTDGVLYLIDPTGKVVDERTR